MSRQTVMENSELKKNTLCLCIATYKRWRVIKDFLEKCASYYLDAGIDIYIYDSSDDNETKHVLDEWKDENKERVYYIRMPIELHANMKVYKLWQFYGFERQYDFVWMSGDPSQFSRRAVKLIIENLSLDYDMIELDVFDKGDIGCKLYMQPNELFVENAWKTTLFGTMILNSHTILANVDWKYYEKKYAQPWVINYSHVSFYFNRAVELNDFQCMHLPLGGDYQQSQYKIESGWRKDVFSVICEGWVRAIKEMPDCYSDRRKAVLDLGIHSVFANKYKFLSLKKDGVYNVRVFLKYFLRWRRVCNIKYRDLLTIALFNFETSKKIEDRRFLRILRMFKRKNECLYLYGAGIVGRRYGKYLSQNGIEYEGYVVTKASDGQKILNDHKIIEVGNLEKNDKIGILISVSEHLSGDVIAQLHKCGYRKQVYYSNELSEWILYSEMLV